MRRNGSSACSIHPVARPPGSAGPPLASALVAGGSRDPQRRAQLGFPLDVVGGEGRHERIEARPDLGRRVVAEQCLGLICGCAATRFRWFGK